MNCPECDAMLMTSERACKKCGWGKVETPKAGGLPEWTGPPPFTPPTAEELEALRVLIATTSAKLGVAAEPTRRTREFGGLKRCERCVTGNFVHMGVRYCLDGYLGRHA